MKNHPHDISYFEVTHFAPHCWVCDEEIIDDFHALVPGIENGSKVYTPICEECLANFLEGEEDADEKAKEEDEDLW